VILKPENILIDKDGHIKLVDFGLSKIVAPDKSNRTNSICGTPEYTAPEVAANKDYDKNIDWWSVGAVFYKLLTGVAPIRSRKSQIDVSNYKGKIDVPSYVSYEAKSFIEEMMQTDPSKRLGSNRGGAEVREHCLFQNIKWDLLSQKKISAPTQQENFTTYCKMFVEASSPEDISITKNLTHVDDNILYDRFSFNGTIDDK